MSRLSLDKTTPQVSGVVKASWRPTASPQVRVRPHRNCFFLPSCGERNATYLVLEMIWTFFCTLNECSSVGLKWEGSIRTSSRDEGLVYASLICAAIERDSFVSSFSVLPMKWTRVVKDGS